MPQRKILFFTSSLNRTGAEVVLFNLICRLDANNFKIGIVITSQMGELVNELPAHINVYKLQTEYNLIEKVRHNLGEDLIYKQLKQIQEIQSYGIWYVNSLSPSYLLKYATRFNVKTVSHLHEISSNYSYLSSTDFKYILDSNLIIACSQIVHKEISNVFDGSLEIVKSAIDTDYIDSFDLNQKIDDDNKVNIICAGSISDRKGTDIFIQVADLLKAEKFKFIWLGNYSNNGYSHWINRTLEKISLSNIEFISPQNQLEYYTQLNNSEYYFSTSREESLGLSMMEAIYLGKPVIALNSGGPSLFIDDTNGILIDSYNVHEIARQLTDYITLRKSNNTKGLVKNHIKDYNLNEEFTKWENLLCQLLP